MHLPVNQRVSKGLKIKSIIANHMGRPLNVTNVKDTSVSSTRCKSCGKSWTEHWKLNSKRKKWPKTCQLKRISKHNKAHTRNIVGVHVRASDKKSTNKTYIIPGCKGCNGLGVTSESKDEDKKYFKFKVKGRDWLVSANQGKCVGKKR